VTHLHVEQLASGAQKTVGKDTSIASVHRSRDSLLSGRLTAKTDATHIANVDDLAMAEARSAEIDLVLIRDVDQRRY